MAARRDEIHSITSLDTPETHEFRVRKWTYLIMMGIRAAAIVVAVVVPGFWRWIAVAAGVCLPYFAVVLVNAVHTKGALPPPDFSALPPDDRPPLPGPMTYPGP